MSTYGKYSDDFKVLLCEEYLQKVSTSVKVSKTKFAIENNVPLTTFLDWLSKYNKYKNSNANEVIINNSETSNKFIEISQNSLRPVNMEDPINKPLSSKIKFKYKDITLEFDKDNLDIVLEAIKRW